MKELNEFKQALKYLEIDAKAYADNFSASMIVSTKNILAIAEAFRALEQRTEENQEVIEEYNAAMCASNEAGYAGVTAAQTIHYLMQRAEAAEAELAELEKQEPIYQLMDDDTWYDAEPHIYHEITAQGYNGRIVYRRPAPAINLAELVPQCLVDAMSNLNLEGVSIGDKAIIAKSIEVLRKIEEAK